MEKWQDPQVIALWIGIALMLFFTILIFVIKIAHAGYKKMTEANLREAQTKLEHQKKLLETNLKAQEEERMRIASDLHDSLVGKLTTIRMQGQMGLPLNEIDRLLGESITEARRISHDLTPPLLEYTSLSELIDEQITPWQKKLEIDYNTDVRVEDNLPANIKIQVLRVLQELITNTIKHAEANTICINLRHTTQGLALIVKDNGKGFDTTVLKKGLGLHSLEMRMQYLNATYKVISAPGKGTKTIIAVSTKNV
ncbi:hypothetical protein GCM10007424_15600 [Flavobacterium suaedae]|uniref:histidine kinase n=1 Tax=Flavobacterium suaedae TaxID=1767027 RepID=A0ABQ1JU61_9FLAO|nr:ATP-binding protein [Flavobacterium suaedae]GGB76476.1 hypothetical protein GCM10007424_15600 [Flavobacterium suaedae]